MSGFKVQRAEPDDFEVLALVLAQAFGPLPQTLAMIPEQDDRDRILRPWFALTLRDVHEQYGHVWCTDDFGSVAVWVRAGRRGGMLPGEPETDHYAELEKIAGKYARVLADFETAQQAYHADETPHEHLALIGTMSDLRGTGHASALLDACLAELDADDYPASLDAATESLRKFYGRWGFIPYGDPVKPFDPPHGIPRMYPAWRPARSAR